MIKLYRKKPVEVQTVQWTGSNVDEVESFVEKGIVYQKLSSSFLIATLEGVMEVSVGDYIIKGVNGECYPCKPDIFAKTYCEVTGKDNDVPTTIVPESLRAQGEWIDRMARDWRCSECGKKVPKQVRFDGYCYDDKLKYCPNCGAFMRGGTGG